MYISIFTYEKVLIELVNNNEFTTITNNIFLQIKIRYITVKKFIK